VKVTAQDLNKKKPQNKQVTQQRN